MGTWPRCACDQCADLFQGVDEGRGRRSEVTSVHVEHLQAWLLELTRCVWVGPAFLTQAEQHFSGRGAANSPPLGSAKTSSSTWRIPWQNCSDKGRWE